MRALREIKMLRTTPLLAGGIFNAYLLVQDAGFIYTCIPVLGS